MEKAIFTAMQALLCQNMFVNCIVLSHQNMSIISKSGLAVGWKNPSIMAGMVAKRT